MFTFPGTTNETQDMIQGYDSLGNLLYQFSVHIDALLSLMRKFISPDYVLLEIDFAEGDRLNLIPIDMNDYQAIMPPICLTPEYNERTLGEICSAIESGLFFRSPFPSHIVQTVIPYIRREEVVHVYKAEEYEDFSDLLEIASCQFKRNQYIDPSLCLTFGAAIAENPDACLEIGRYYNPNAARHPMEKNPGKAIKWYMKAARQNMPEAVYEMGMLYKASAAVL